MANMGLQYGLQDNSRCFKRKFRWQFSITDVSADDSPGSSALPPNKAARPNLTFKEIEVQHLTETVFIPGKPDWKPITLTLYDVGATGVSPVFKWLQLLYDPANKSTYNFPADTGFFKQATLKMLSGYGDTLETWTFENCWVQSCDFGDLDMGNSEIVMCDLTLRYARAYITQ